MRKLFHVLLSLVIVYASTMSAYAASPAGWTATAADAVMAGATATITAFKGSGSTAMKAVISHKPTAVAVGKELVKGGGVIALAYAMSKLLDAGIDWVMTEGGDVKYKNPAFGTTEPFSKFLFKHRPTGILGVTPNSASDPFVISQYGDGIYIFDTTNCVMPITGVANDCYVYYKKIEGGGSIQVQVTTVVNPASPTPAEEYKYISMDTVAAKVLANAEAGHAPSQDFVKAVAVGAVDAGELDTALDAVAEPTTDTANPDAPPIDPTKPYDDSGIKDLLKKILAALSGISAISALLEFFKDEPVEKESKPVDVDVPQPTKAPNEFDVSYVKFGGQCPAMPSFSIDILGASSSMTFDMTPLCNLAVAIRPAIVAIAYFIGLGVIASAIRET